MRGEGVMLSFMVASSSVEKHCSNLQALKNIPFGQLPAPAQLLIIIFFLLSP